MTFAIFTILALLGVWCMHLSSQRPERARIRVTRESEVDFYLNEKNADKRYSRRRVASSHRRWPTTNRYIKLKLPGLSPAWKPRLSTMVQSAMGFFRSRKLRASTLTTKARGMTTDDPTFAMVLKKARKLLFK